MAGNEDVARRSQRLLERALRDEDEKADDDVAELPRQEQGDGDHPAGSVPADRVPEANPGPAAVPVGIGANVVSVDFNCEVAVG